jgi:EPS-associated MarR family transcriptional regulator
MGTVSRKKFQEENEDILMLLRAIEANPRLTQRELAARMGLSLGKINFLIKALIKKGLVKVKNFKSSSNKIAYLYCLTPRGIEEKAKITYHFLKMKMSEYEKLEEEIRQLKHEVMTDDIAKIF